jgi:hypothetical protein
MMYIQCELRRGDELRVAWLPEREARVGSTVKLKENGHWLTGWKVAFAYGRLPEDLLVSMRIATEPFRKGNQ